MLGRCPNEKYQSLRIHFLHFVLVHPLSDDCRSRLQPSLHIRMEVSVQVRCALDHLIGKNARSRWILLSLGEFIPDKGFEHLGWIRLRINVVEGSVPRLNGGFKNSKVKPSFGFVMVMNIGFGHAGTVSDSLHPSALVAKLCKFVFCGGQNALGNCVRARTIRDGAGFIADHMIKYR